MSRVTELFARRLAQRRGETRPEEAGAMEDLDRFGEEIGVPRMPSAPTGAQGKVAMPGRPAASPGGSMPAGDALAAMAPPGGGPSTDARPTSTIPALDEMAQRPMRKTRGLLHRRSMGRVM